MQFIKNKSLFFNRLFNRSCSIAREESRLEESFLHNLCSLYSPQDQMLIRKNWKEIYHQALRNCGFKGEEVVFDSDKQSALEKELSEIILSIESKGFIPYFIMDLIEGEEVRNFMKYMIHDITFGKEVSTKRYFKSLLVKKDESFFEELREEFAHLFERIYSQLLERRWQNDEIAQMFIGHLLSTYVLLEPKENSSLPIPQKIEGKWKLITYKITHVDITPGYLFHPLHAYGMLPTHSFEKAQPLLIFRSTPLPTGKSSLMAMMSDFTPGFSVGEALYLIGKKTLHKWVITQYNRYNNRIKLYGQSLGGSMAHHLALDMSDLVEVYTYVPAGMLKRSLKGNKTIKGKLFSHGNDFVSLLNKQPESLSYVRVITEKKRNPLLAHFKIFGTERTILIKVHSKRENKRFIRLIASAIHQLFSLPLFTVKALLFMGVLANKHLQLLCKKAKEEPIAYFALKR